MAADYIYKNKNDSMRFRIFAQYVEGCGVHWDVDIYSKKDGGYVGTFSECGEIFYTKKEAKEWITGKYGIAKSIQPKSIITEGW